MNLEVIRSKLNIHRLIMKKQKISERQIECYIEVDGEITPVKRVEMHENNGKYSIIFK